jgi:3-oxoacyl-[acyl-carrier-protein] synthase II
MNTNGCAASMFSVGDAYRLIKDGYQHIMFTGGVDKNIGNFSHYILDTLAALNWYSNSEPLTACRPFDVERHGAV